jgi:hypothetical protein
LKPHIHPKCSYFIQSYDDYVGGGGDGDGSGGGDVF